MLLGPQFDRILTELAARYDADENVLRAAIEDESVVDLGRVLGLDPSTPELERVVRAVTVQTDLGAGCKLLTDDVQAELLDALAALC